MDARVVCIPRVGSLVRFNGTSNIERGIVFGVDIRSFQFDVFWEKVGHLTMTLHALALEGNYMIEVW